MGRVTRKKKKKKKQHCTFAGGLAQPRKPDGNICGRTGAAGLKAFLVALQSYTFVDYQFCCKAPARTVRMNLIHGSCGSRDGGCGSRDGPLQFDVFLSYLRDSSVFALSLSLEIAACLMADRVECVPVVNFGVDRRDASSTSRWSTAAAAPW